MLPFLTCLSFLKGLIFLQEGVLWAGKTHDPSHLGFMKWESGDVESV